MADILALAGANLVSPLILSFALGVAAALLRSDLSVPEAAAKAISIYLLFAIGFKGGVAVAAHGLDARLSAGLGAGVALSFALPLLAFALLGLLTRLPRLDRAVVAAHYGSISIVTFVAATAVVESRGLDHEGWMVSVAAAMEAPAILTALWLAGPRTRAAGPERSCRSWAASGARAAGQARDRWAARAWWRSSAWCAPRASTPSWRRRSGWSSASSA